MIDFTKYHALGNSFFVLEKLPPKLDQKQFPELAVAMCDLSNGIGADGILILSPSKNADKKFDIYNADGSWAEKSGNGLRIAGLHLHLNSKKKKFKLETSCSIDEVALVSKEDDLYNLKTSLGSPEFDTKKIPVKSDQKFLINSPIKVSGYNFPVTCLSVGNPHTVLFVDNFDFDWKTLGAEIEHLQIFPNRTNVEFVKIMTRKKIKVNDWERGAGATGSSGTGAAAAVAAGVMNGQLDRNCQVDFETGSLFIDWLTDNNIIELTGPAQMICKGTFKF